MKPTQLIPGDRVKVKPHACEEFEATFIQRVITTGEVRRVGKCRFLGLKSQTYFWLNDSEVYHQVKHV